MALNRNLLRAYVERNIHINVFLKLLDPVKGLEGEEREAFQNQVAEKIEKEYPYRPGKEPKEES